MTDKRTPTYDLDTVRAWAASEQFTATYKATETAAELGFTSDDMADVIQRMQRIHFYKSTTSFADHRIWQDVYNVPSDVGMLYVKFTASVVTEFVLLSFKEKDNG